jgi:mitogen-activated protein kinase organizer 1
MAAALPTWCAATIQGRQGAVFCARFTRDGSYVMTAGQDRSIMLWNPSREDGSVAGPELECMPARGDPPRVLRKPVATFSAHSHEVFGLAIAPDNSRFVSCGGDKLVIVWDVASGRAVRKLTGHSHRVNAVALNADASVAFSAGYDTSVRCWDLRSQMREPIQQLLHATDSVASLHVHGHKIATGCVDGCVRVYDLRFGTLDTHTVGPPVASAVISRDGNCALACTLDDRIRLLDLASGELLASYGDDRAGEAAAGGAGARPSASAFACRIYKLEAVLSSDDAHVLAGSETGALHVWDLVSAETVARLTGHTAPVCSVASHPDVAYCAALTGSHDGTARLWIP